MENDLISRSALIEQLERLAVHEDAFRQSCILGIVHTIAKAPAVDAVEVVRCKDCKHYMTIHCTCDGCCISDYWFCADVERRADDG